MPTATGKIIWDPGHGGRDPGAISSRGLREKDLALDIAQRIARLEPGFGGRVTFHFTRLTDTDLAPQAAPFSEAADLQARSEYANQVPRAADREDRRFISLHLNSDGTRTARGLSLWSYPGSTRGAETARLLLEQINKHASRWLGILGTGLFTANFHVLRETVMPAALVEAGFIGTPTEAEQLGKPEVRQAIAEGAVLAASEMLGERYRFQSDNDLDYEHFDLSTPSHAIEQELERALAGTAMAGLSTAFLRAERELGLNAVALAAHAAWESAWGSSRIARDKNNLFGYGASDDDPYNNARSFQTREEGILYVAQQIRRNYLAPDGPYHHGSNLRGMNVRYATDQNWRHGIAALWGRIRPFALRFGTPATEPAPAPTPAPTPAPNPETPRSPELDLQKLRLLIRQLRETLQFLEALEASTIE